MEDLMSLAQEQNRTIADLVIEHEAIHTRKSAIFIEEQMQAIWQVMKDSAEKGVNNTKKSVSGMVGGDAKKLFSYKNSFCGDFVSKLASWMCSSQHARTCAASIFQIGRASCRERV